MIRAVSTPELEVSAKRLHARSRSRLSSTSNSRRVSVRTDFEVIDDSGLDPSETPVKRWSFTRKRRAKTPEKRSRPAINAASVTSIKSEPIEIKTTKTVLLRQKIANEQKKAAEALKGVGMKRPSPAPRRRSVEKAQSSAPQEENIQVNPSDQTHSTANWPIIDKNDLKLDFRGLHDEEDGKKYAPVNPALESASPAVATASSAQMADQDLHGNQADMRQSPVEALGNIMRSTVDLATGFHSGMAPMEGHVDKEGYCACGRELTKNSTHNPVHGSPVVGKTASSTPSRKIFAYNRRSRSSKEGDHPTETSPMVETSENMEKRSKPPTPPSANGSTPSSKKLASYRRSRLHSREDGVEETHTKSQASHDFKSSVVQGNGGDSEEDGIKHGNNSGHKRIGQLASGGEGKVETDYAAEVAADMLEAASKSRGLISSEKNGQKMVEAGSDVKRGKVDQIRGSGHIMESRQEDKTDKVEEKIVTGNHEEDTKLAQQNNLSSGHGDQRVIRERTEQKEQNQKGNSDQTHEMDNVIGQKTDSQKGSSRSKGGIAFTVDLGEEKGIKGSPSKLEKSVSAEGHTNLLGSGKSDHSIRSKPGSSKSPGPVYDLARQTIESEARRSQKPEDQKTPSGHHPFMVNHEKGKADPNLHGNLGFNATHSPVRAQHKPELGSSNSKQRFHNGDSTENVENHDTLSLKNQPEMASKDAQGHETSALVKTNGRHSRSNPVSVRTTGRRLSKSNEGHKTARSLGGGPLLTPDKLDTIRQYLEEQTNVDQDRMSDVHEAIALQQSNRSEKKRTMDPVYHLTLVVERITDEKRQLTDLCTQLLHQMQLATSKLIDIENRQEQSLLALLPKESHRQQDAQDGNRTGKSGPKCERCKELEKMHQEKIDQLRLEHEEKMNRLKSSYEGEIASLKKATNALNAQTVPLETPQPVDMKPVQPESSLQNDGHNGHKTEENFGETQIQLIPDHKESSRSQKIEEIPPIPTEVQVQPGAVHKKNVKESLETQFENQEHPSEVLNAATPPESKFSNRFQDLQQENHGLKKQLEDLQQRVDALSKLIKPT